MQAKVAKAVEFYQKLGLSEGEKEMLLEKIYRDLQDFPASTLIRNIQVNRYVDLKFHQGTRGGEMKCRKFSEIIADPDFTQDLSKALLVIGDNFVPLKYQIERVGAKLQIDLERVESAVSKENTYWLYDIEDGRKTLGMPAVTTRKEFRKVQRRGLSLEQGICFLAQRPNILRRHFLLFPESSYKEGYVPGIVIWEQEPVIGAFNPGCIPACFGTPSYRMI